MTNSPPWFCSSAFNSPVLDTYMDIQSWTRLKHRPASASSSLSSSDPTLRLLWEERDIPRGYGQARHNIQLQERDVLKAHKGKERRLGELTHCSNVAGPDCLKTSRAQ